MFAHGYVPAFPFLSLEWLAEANTLSFYNMTNLVNDLIALPGEYSLCIFWTSHNYHADAHIEGPSHFSIFNFTSLQIL